MGGESFLFVVYVLSSLFSLAGECEGCTVLCRAVWCCACVCTRARASVCVGAPPRQFNTPITTTGRLAAKELFGGDREEDPAVQAKSANLLLAVTTGVCYSPSFRQARGLTTSPFTHGNTSCRISRIHTQLPSGRSWGWDFTVMERG